MDTRTLIRRLQWSWTKNRPEVQALTMHLYPEFVFARRPNDVRDEIPVFNFHGVDEGDFVEKIAYLAGNGYRTIDSEAFRECLSGERPIEPKTVLLTFDDGWESLHSVAAPILRKHGMKAVCFLIPGVMALNRERPPAYPGAEALITWDEARRDADVIDFQSHSMWHHRVHVSPKLVDFVHPAFESYALRLHVPVVREGDRDRTERLARLGTPVYEYAPRLAGRPRYFDDEALREACVAHVREHGGERFFDDPKWRKRLMQVCRDHTSHRGKTESFESVEQMRDGIRRDLLESRQIIERELPGKAVHALCYPWFLGSDVSMRISKETGYASSYWGVLRGRRTNRAGDDPFRVVRMPPEYIMRLPGKGRWSLLDVMKRMFRRSAPRFLRRASAAPSSSQCR